MIGAGGIAGVALSTLVRELGAPLDHVSVLVREPFVLQAQHMLDVAGDALAGTRVVRTEIAELLGDAPDVVAECASHSAVANFGPPILESGCDLIVISIGAIADDTLRARLEEAAGRGGCRLLLPPGAVGGIDALAAARLSGLKQVIYTGRKPPKAWRGTPAEALLDLEALQAPQVFFEGSARSAARDYPLNANVAATLALAGIGFEQTQVRLVADPGITANVHEFTVSSACGEFNIRLEGRASATNPKTSLMAGYSLARELLNRTRVVVI
jgi:aspartate dehydrogenase